MADNRKLIDANALEGHIAECFGYPAVDILHEVATFPTVDAVEVVHGRWEILDDGYGCELMCCSVCKSEFYDGDNDTVDHTHNYCPNCGAKMDGERKDNG